MKMICEKGLNESPFDYSRFPTNPTPDLCTFLGDKSEMEKTIIEQGRDTLAWRRIPNSWPSTKFHIFRPPSPPPGYAVDRRTIDRLLYDY